VTAAVYIEEMFGYKFKDEDRLHQALKRPTASLKSTVKNGHRLELVGDGVLGNLSFSNVF
jgi:dsRNA-specific ribonuclease